MTTWNEEVFQMLKSRLRCGHSYFDGTANPDVYKRQILNSKGFRAAEVNGQSEDRAEIPVSYTHLDVYKRQVPEPAETSTTPTDANTLPAPDYPADAGSATQSLSAAGPASLEAEPEATPFDYSGPVSYTHLRIPDFGICISVPETSRKHQAALSFQDPHEPVSYTHLGGIAPKQIEIVIQEICMLYDLELYNKNNELEQERKKNEQQDRCV